MFSKSMKFIRFLNRGNFYFSNNGYFQIWWLISGMDIMKNTKFQLNISKIMPPRTKKILGDEV